MELHRLSLEIQAASMEGIRPRDWAVASLLQAFAQSVVRDDDWAEVGLLAYYYALDNGDATAAGRFLEQVLSNFEDYSPNMRHGLALEAAYYYAFHCQNPIQGQAWLRRGRESLFGPHTRLRAEAAVLVAEGQPEFAAQKAREGLGAVVKCYDRGLAEAEAEWMRAMILQAR